MNFIDVFRTSSNFSSIILNFFFGDRPMSAMSGGVHVDAVVVSALARDLCSWVQVLGNLLVPPMDNDHGAFVAAASNAGPSVVEEKRSGMLPRTDVNVSTKNKGATVQRIAVQWPAGVTSGRVPRSVLESLEVAVRCSDKDTSSGVAPALGKGKGGSRASDEKTPYVRTGPLSVKQRDRLAATQLARTAAWVEARCLAPGRSYTVKLEEVKRILFLVAVSIYACYCLKRFLSLPLNFNSCAIF